MANWELLKELSNAPGIPGNEDKIREIVIREIKDYVEGFEIDPLGNLIIHAGGNGPKLLLDAHMDEVGFMVSKIEEGGFLRVIPVGGIPPENAHSQRVIIWGKRPIYGIFGSTPPHVRMREKDKLPDIEELFIDTGLDEDEVRALISPGDAVTFDTQAIEQDGAILGKAFDDRVGVFVMIESLKRAKKRSVDLYLVAAVQEEIGLRGATTAAFGVEPLMAIALEGTVALDTPGVPDTKKLAEIGKGPEIRLSDRSFVASKKWVEFISELAKSKGIKHQLIVKKVGATDATVIQISRKGVFATAISVPVRYIHSANSFLLKEDIDETIKLVTAIIEEGGKFLETVKLGKINS